MFKQSSLIVVSAIFTIASITASYSQNASRECPVDKNGKAYCGNNCPLCK